MTPLILILMVASFVSGFIYGSERIMRQIRRNHMEDLLDKNRSTHPPAADREVKP